jgi:acetoin utilization protein AcuB
LELGPGVLGRIADVVEGAGAVLQAIYPIGRHNGHADAGKLEKQVIIRFHARAVQEVVSALEAAGFPVIEPVEMHRAALAARLPCCALPA